MLLNFLLWTKVDKFNIVNQENDSSTETGRILDHFRN